MEDKLNHSVDQLKREIQMAETIEQCLQTERERLYIEKLRLTEKLEELIEDKNIIEHLPDAVSQEKWKEVKDLLEDIRNDEIHLLELKHRKRLASLAQEEEEIYRELRYLSGVPVSSIEEKNRTILINWFHQLKNLTSDLFSIHNIDVRQKQFKKGKILQEELSFSLHYCGFIVHITIKTENEFESSNCTFSTNTSNGWRVISCSVSSDLATQEIADRGQLVIRALGSVSIFIKEICDLLDVSYLKMNK